MRIRGFVLSLYLRVCGVLLCGSFNVNNNINIINNIINNAYNGITNNGRVLQVRGGTLGPWGQRRSHVLQRRHRRAQGAAAKHTSFSRFALARCFNNRATPSFEFQTNLQTPQPCLA